MPTGKGWPPASALISFGVRVLMGGVLALTGLSKISDPFGFIATLWAYKLLPEPVVPLLTVYLPWLELEVGLLLIFGVFWRFSALVSAGLNGFFLLALALLLARGLEVDCGCFSMLSDKLCLPDSADFVAVGRQAVFTAMSLYLLLSRETAFSLEGFLRR